MGKSANGAVWLNEEKLSPFDFWQFWRNTEDDDVERFLGLFTEIPIDEIKRLGTLKGSEINHAKIILANHATSLCHGDKAAREAEETAKTTFDKRGVAGGLPQVKLKHREANGLSVVSALTLLDLAKSNGEARRLIQGRGAKVNDVTVKDTNEVLHQNDFVEGKVQISAGKKRHAIIIIDQ